MSIYTSILTASTFLFSGFVLLLIVKRKTGILWKIFSYVASTIVTTVFAIIFGIVLFELLAPDSASLPIEMIVGRAFAYGVIGPLIGYWLIKIAFHVSKSKQ
jgi:hypothetical protein